MGLILRMDSKKFLKDFLPGLKSPEEFQFILVSENITTAKKFKQVTPIQKLLPPPAVMSSYVNENEKAYRKAYLNYLKSDQVDALIAIIVKAAVANDLNIVLLCSKSEAEFGYVDMICEYIEQVYDMKTYTLKKYDDNPEKARKVKNKDDILKILAKKFEKIDKMGANDLNLGNNKDKLVKELGKLGRKELRRIAKAKNIKLDKDLEKKEMVKKIVKKLSA